MCIAAPAKVVELDKDEKVAFVEFGGVKQRAKIDLMPDIELGDYVLVHAGYAIEKLTEQAAQGPLEAWNELLEILDEEDQERIQENN